MMNKSVGKITCSGSGRSTRSSSSRASANMQVDVPGASSSATNILLEEKHIHWQNKQEKDTFKKLKTKRFVHTSAYDPVLLQVVGKDVEFDLIFRTIGWEGVWNVVEQGSKFLRSEFLCTLQITDIGVKFRLFGKEFSYP